MMISLDLLKKYPGSLPRYTSYPTVADWTQAPTECEWIQHLTAALDADTGGKGAALYIHVPFCEMLCTYCGCSTRITKNHQVAEGYIGSILKEWDLYRERLQRRLSLSVLYLGGGTPTFFSPEELKLLMGKITATAEIATTRSFTVEADPRVTQRAHLEVLFAHGFNEISLGVQDFDPTVQEIVNRVHSEDRIRQVTEVAREIGFSKVNYDLIYGLPRQTLKSFESTFKAVERLQPDRISFYGYIHVPWIRHGQRQFTEDDLPSAEEKCHLYHLGYQLLFEMGYREIGMNHFVRKSDPLWEALTTKKLHRNFMGYFPWVATPLIGLGVSAMGDSWTAFAQNEKQLEMYQARIAAGELPLVRGHQLNENDLVLRKHIFNLITQMETHGSFDSLALTELAKDGLVRLGSNVCEVTEMGRGYLRNICAAFDLRRRHRGRL